MSLFFFPPKEAGTAVVTPSSEPSFPAVPTLHARIAWRPEDIASGITFSALPWNGTTTGWIINGTAHSGPPTSLIQNFSDSFGGGPCLEVETAGTALSGMDYRIVGTFTSGRTYRARAALRNISGSVRLDLRLGVGSPNFAVNQATIDSDWTFYTVDWTPASTYGTAWVSLRNGEAATQTTLIDHVELYEAIDEVTLESLHVTRGSRFDGGAEAPGTIEFSILDPSAIYTPRNTASPIYGHVEVGRKVHIRADHLGWLHGLAYGVIRSVTPDPWTKTVRFAAEDGLSELDGYTVSRGFDADLSYAQARASALSAEALGTAQHELVTGSIESGTFHDGTDSEVSLLSYLESLNEATGSIHWCRPHQMAAYPWRYATIGRTTLTDDTTGLSILDSDFQDLTDVDSRDESLVTRQRVRWRGYEVRPAQVLVEATPEVPYWTFLSEEYGSSDTPEPEEIYRLKRVKGRRRRKRRKLRRVGTRWVDAIVPVTIVDATHQFIADFLCPVQDPSVSVTATGSISTATVTEPSRVLVNVTATGTAVVTGLSISGMPAIPLDDVDEQSDTPSAVIVRDGNEIDNEYVPSAGAAQGLADYITWRYGTSRLRPSVTLQHYMNRQLFRHIGDHVTLTADRWYISSGPYVVRSIEHDVSHAGLDWETTFGLEELPDGTRDWFTLGSSLLDGSAVLAY